MSGLNHLNLKTAPGKQIRFFGGSGAGNIWNFDGSGHLVPGYDNGYDIGSQLYRVRDLNLARDVIVGGKVKFGVYTGQALVDKLAAVDKTKLADIEKAIDAAAG